MSAAFASTLPVARDVPVDRTHLLAQVPEATGDPAAFYLTHWHDLSLDPTPWFLSDWYAWQNPDWPSHGAPYLHYLDTGRYEGRDPSPFVDAWRYRAVTGVAPEAVYDLVCRGHRSPALGVYEDRRDLECAQKAFLSGIGLATHRIAPGPPARALVVLQAGPGSLAETWFDDIAREWDLLVNYYDATGFRPDFGDHVVFQKGTKFTAMWMLWHRFRPLLESYDHVLFLDDDVETSGDALNRLFRACRAHDLDLAQMALTDRSSCNWAELFARPGMAGPRKVSAVEIMMPVVSRRGLRLVAPTFGRSISGFGLDLAWGRLLRDAGARIAVLDDVTATHARPVDQAGGAYYSYLRRHYINPKAELWTMLADYDAERSLVSD